MYIKNAETQLPMVGKPFNIETLLVWSCLTATTAMS